MNTGVLTTTEHVSTLRCIGPQVVAIGCVPVNGRAEIFTAVRLAQFEAALSICPSLHPT